MVLLRKAVSLAVPASVALIAFLHAHAIGALIDGAAAPASIAPFAEARAATSTSMTPRAKSADKVLDRNPFDHVTGSLRPTRIGDGAVPSSDLEDPMSAPLCDDVRALVTVRTADADSSFGAFDVHGRRVLEARGGELGSASHDDENFRVVYVAEDRVWLSRNGSLCQARVFGG